MSKLCLTCSVYCLHLRHPMSLRSIPAGHEDTFMFLRWFGASNYMDYPNDQRAPVYVHVTQACTSYFCRDHVIGLLYDLYCPGCSYPEPLRPRLPREAIAPEPALVEIGNAAALCILIVGCSLDVVSGLTNEDGVRIVSGLTTCRCGNSRPTT